MSTPDEAVQAGLAEQAASIGGVDSAGIFGDPAGASLHAPGQTEQDVAQNLVQAGAEPMTADADALQAQIDQLTAERDSARAEAAANAPVVEVPKSELRQALEAVSGVAPDLIGILTKIVDHIEGK